ncbi:hypothetical protein IG193_00620 [Infirmifilum lucidum]|uniref:Uncharacterized protein n=1 Tax=Infirmifilum lucidum TaxID=2776706 RepID=A0A7L9FJA1_9CREN|nr:hypothetical protein [Infirmifilum lucidum]QOJ79004.1 hypothetical protein IG193_00620 [Infirmifilum lucidum]
MELLKLATLLQRASFTVDGNRLRVYVDGRHVADVLFHDEKLLDTVVKALRKHGKIRQD